MIMRLKFQMGLVSSHFQSQNRGKFELVAKVTSDMQGEYWEDWSMTETKDIIVE